MYKTRGIHHGNRGYLLSNINIFYRHLFVDDASGKSLSGHQRCSPCELDLTLYANKSKTYRTALIATNTLNHCGKRSPLCHSYTLHYIIIRRRAPKHLCDSTRLFSRKIFTRVINFIATLLLCTPRVVEAFAGVLLAKYEETANLFLSALRRVFPQRLMFGGRHIHAETGRQLRPTTSRTQ